MADILENVGHWGREFVSTTHAELPPALARMEWWWKCVLRAWAFRRACAPALARVRAALLVVRSVLTLERSCAQGGGRGDWRSQPGSHAGGGDSEPRPAQHVRVCLRPARHAQPRNLD